MKNQFEDFQKMTLKKACQAMEDMTYSFVNPVTGEPTFVPAKHYEKILSQTVEIFLEDNLKIEMLNTVYKQLQFIKEEYGKDFLRSLILMDMGLKPTDLSIPETIALEETYSCMVETQNKEKKKFHLIDQEFIDKFKEAKEDKALHTQYIKTIKEQEQEQGLDCDKDDDFEIER